MHPILRILSADELLQISFSPINQNQRYPNGLTTKRLSNQTAEQIKKPIRWDRLNRLLVEAIIAR
ncbi:hypothetical protein DDM70_15285 [Vibrio cholerae]|nr:hypothetical protein [Vibrio cholerae]EGR1061796.1 hypothetical protein [Vibrio cholerae]EGR2519583.1 hypothetical protein [Vibrio cholerae]EGR2526874.1 hypothetical protein [Vibrio cholerae]EGR4059231.1 hypothetical protein [Vibrio cholerae]